MRDAVGILALQGGEDVNPGLDLQVVDDLRGESSLVSFVRNFFRLCLLCFLLFFNFS